MDSKTTDRPTASFPNERVARTAIQRLLDPRSIAIVGMSPTSGLLGFIEPVLRSDAQVYFVNPKHRTVLGRPCYDSVSQIGGAVDLVYSVMSAERSVQLAEECADLDCGGMVIYAAGFNESGEATGRALQERLVTAARRGNMAVIGPNSLGYVNVPRSVRLSASQNYSAPAGGISIVTHSGAMMGAIEVAVESRFGAGLNQMISAGNEAVTDMADFISYLVDDPATTAIGLVVESIRRPPAFFAAVRRARDAGKPVVALKLARSSRTQAMAASHTGAVVGSSQIYDIAFEQAGIIAARDVEDLVDRLSLLTQIDPSRWSRVEKLGVIAGTGGFSSLAFDVAVDEGVPVPELESLREWVEMNIPGISVPNPLDTTGFGAQIWTDIVEKYITSPDLDAVMLVNLWGRDDDSPLVRWLVEEVFKVAERESKPVVLSAGSGTVGRYLEHVVGDGGVLGFGYGIRPTIRGLAALGQTVRARDHRRPASDDTSPLPRPRPTPEDMTMTPEGSSILRWTAAHSLLAEYGIPTSPYHLMVDPTDRLPDFQGPYAAKIADLAHRSENGGVKVGVTADQLPEVVADLQCVADSFGVPRGVAVQPMADIEGELLLGVDCTTELGPAVILGLGGIFVEVLRRASGRMAPLTTADARELIEELRDVQVVHGYRGSEPWDLDGLAELLFNLGQLAAASTDWLESLDINPLVFGSGRYCAVDVLCTVKPDLQ